MNIVSISISIFLIKTGNFIIRRNAGRFWQKPINLFTYFEETRDLTKHYRKGGDHPFKQFSTT